MTRTSCQLLRMIASAILLLLPVTALAATSLASSRMRSAALAIDPTEPTRMFALRDDALYRSDDAGRRWARVTQPLQNASQPHVFPDRTVMVRGERRITANHREQVTFASSTDGGSTWSTRTVTFPAPGSLVTDPRDPRVRYLWGTERRDLRRDPTTGALAFVTPPSPMLQPLYPDLVTHGDLDAATGVGVSYVLKSVDGGDAWSALDVRAAFRADEKFRIMQLVVDPNDSQALLALVQVFAAAPDTALARGPRAVIRSADGGAHWEILTLAAPASRFATDIQSTGLGIDAFHVFSYQHNTNGTSVIGTLQRYDAATSARTVFVRTVRPRPNSFGIWPPTISTDARELYLPTDDGLLYSRDHGNTFRVAARLVGSWNGRIVTSLGTEDPLMVFFSDQRGVLRVANGRTARP